jgi:hypothetical protein
MQYSEHVLTSFMAGTSNNLRGWAYLRHLTIQVRQMLKFTAQASPPSLVLHGPGSTTFPGLRQLDPKLHHQFDTLLPFCRCTFVLHATSNTSALILALNHHSLLS